MSVCGIVAEVSGKPIYSISLSIYSISLSRKTRCVCVLQNDRMRVSLKVCFAYIWHTQITFSFIDFWRKKASVLCVEVS